MASQDEYEIDVGQAIGADDGAAIQCLTLYIPSQDRNGVAFDQRPWVEEALKLLSAIGGGATALPPVDGAWLNPETQELIREKVVLAYTYVDAEKFVARLPALRAFLHRLGRETDQGETVFEFDDRLYKIRAYDRNR